MSSVQSNEVVCLPQEPQIHNEAQDLLLLQDYVHRLTNTLRTLEDTHAVLQQTELLAGVINEQDCRDIRTACCCSRSLRIRLEARANVTEREVISRQLQLMHASVQQHRTEDLTQLTQVACPEPLLCTLRIDLVPGQRKTLVFLHQCNQASYHDH